MTVVVGNGSNVAGQEGDCVHYTQVPEPSRMADEHVCHMQHGCCMCPAKKNSRIQQPGNAGSGSLFPRHRAERASQQI